MSAFYKIGEFADKIGVSISTLRRWDKEGKLKPAKITDGGTRYYSDYQLRTYVAPELDERIVLAYSRGNLPLLESFLVSKGYCFKIEPDLMEMITAVESNKVHHLVFYTRQDILLADEIITESAFRLLKAICDLHEVVLDIVKVGDNYDGS